MPGLPQDTERLQSPAYLSARPAIRDRQPVAQCAVGEAQPEVGDHVGRLQAAPAQKPERIRRLLQRVVVKGHHLSEDLGIAGLPLNRRRQLAHGRRSYSRHWHGKSGVVGTEQINRMPETDALSLHHPIDHRAAGLAGAEAAPDVSLGTNHQGRFVIVVKGAQSEQVRAVPLKAHSRRFDEALKGNRLFLFLDHVRPCSGAYLTLEPSLREGQPGVGIGCLDAHDFHVVAVAGINAAEFGNRSLKRSS